jgi:PAT family beta-lactamase induction signal transducer AmpG
VPPPEAKTAPEPKQRADAAYLWVASSYFAEGYPYSIVNNLAEILYRDLGASLGAVGLTSLFHLPWNLKFLWAPLIDHYETKRRWLLGVEMALCGVLALLAPVVSSASMLGVISVLFLLLGILSATHDAAIDGFYLEALDETRQSRYVGLRQLAYKLANLLVRGPAIVLAGLVGWRLGFVAMAALMLLILGLHAWVLPKTEQRKRSLADLAALGLRPRVLAVFALALSAIVLDRQFGWWGHARSFVGGQLGSSRLRKITVEGWIGVALLIALVVLASLRRRLMSGDSPYRAAFAEFLSQPRAGVILAFVILFRTGESFLQKMKWPFFRDSVHLSLEQYGLSNGTFGVIASFAGTLAGGWLISKHGLRRWIWPFVIAQNGLHLLYVFLAQQSVAGPVDIVTVTSVICIEHIGEGLGTAVFTVFLMRCCDPAHKAAHMAIVTAIMSIGFTVAGMASGYLAQELGFINYFLFTFVVTIPSMGLIFFLPYLDGRPRKAISA